MMINKSIVAASLLALTSASNLRTHEKTQAGGIVMVDGGSSGSKLFSFSAAQKGGVSINTDLKILSECTTDTSKYPLKGVSSYAYDEEGEANPCKSKVLNTLREEADALPVVEDKDGQKAREDAKKQGISTEPPTETTANAYAKFLLSQIKWIHEERDAGVAVDNYIFPCHEQSQIAYKTRGPSDGDDDKAKILCAAADNKQNIPFMATAGMRLLTQKQNDAVWSNICGVEEDLKDGEEPGSGYKFAPQGDACGTIPGTQEAYYEWLANAAAGEQYMNTGTFTIGGASAQIAIPLVNDVMIKAWNTMIKKVEDHYGDCSTIMLPDDAGPIPIFSDTETKKCARDFVDIKMAEDIYLSDELKRVSGIGTKVKAVGLVSYLGLRGTGGKTESGVAGGANLVGDDTGSWAVSNGCDPVYASTHFEECRKKLKAALHEDYLFEVVKLFFHQHRLGVSHFSYNTAAAIPSFAWSRGSNKGNEAAFQAKINNMQSKDSSPNVHLAAAAELKKELLLFCTEKDHAHFGFKNSNNCMKAAWTGLYVSEFFDDGYLYATMSTATNSKEKIKEMAQRAMTSVATGHMLNIHIQRQRIHGVYSDLHYKGLDWSEGAYQESSAMSNSKEVDGDSQEHAGTEIFKAEDGMDDKEEVETTEKKKDVLKKFVTPLAFLELAQNNMVQFHTHSYIDGLAIHLVNRNEIKKELEADNFRASSRN